MLHEVEENHPLAAKWRDVNILERIRIRTRLTSQIPIILTKKLLGLKKVWRNRWNHIIIFQTNFLSHSSAPLTNHMFNVQLEFPSVLLNSLLFAPLIPSRPQESRTNGCFLNFFLHLFLLTIIMYRIPLHLWRQQRTVVTTVTLYNNLKAQTGKFFLVFFFLYLLKSVESM